MAVPAVNQTIHKLFREGHSLETIAESLDLDVTAIAAVVSQMPTKSERVAEDAKSKFSSHIDSLSDVILELAESGESEIVRLGAAKFGLQMASGYYDPKRIDPHAGGISVVTINNILQAGQSAYEKQLKQLEVIDVPA